ncbi:MAG: hypothetical protein ACRET1_00670 [Burkholderiales bacterium]
MRAPSAAELLDIWEIGASLPPPRRTLLLLAAACPDASGDDLASLPLGRCDACLLQLREYLFGDDLTVIAACPACGAQLESRFQTADIKTSIQPGEQAYTIRAGGCDVSFRLPAGADLVAVGGSADAGSGRSLLLARCVVEARNPAGDIVEPKSLPHEVVAEITARMAVIDPQADIRLDLACPACAHRWQAPFDIAAFLWSELQSWARRTLREVHALAHVYGWREADVLALSPTRRQIYLELSRQ